MSSYTTISHINKLAFLREKIFDLLAEDTRYDNKKELSLFLGFVSRHVLKSAERQLQEVEVRLLRERAAELEEEE